jgi:hypothetical protein
MLGIVIFISLILIACNAFYETDETKEKIDGNKLELKK